MSASHTAGDCRPRGSVSEVPRSRAPRDPHDRQQRSRETAAKRAPEADAILFAAGHGRLLAECCRSRAAPAGFIRLWTGVESLVSRRRCWPIRAPHQRPRRVPLASGGLGDGGDAALLLRPGPRDPATAGRRVGAVTRPVLKERHWELSATAPSAAPRRARAKVFGMKIAALRRRPSSLLQADRIGGRELIRARQLNELIAASDYLLLALPSRRRRAGLIGAAADRRHEAQRRADQRGPRRGGG